MQPFRALGNLHNEMRPQAAFAHIVKVARTHFFKIDQWCIIGQADMQQSYYQQDRLYREQLLATKLKPLIREILNKGK